MTFIDRRDFLRQSAAVAAFTLAGSLLDRTAQARQEEAAKPASATRFAQGTVYHDRNGNGVRDAGEPGIRGVCVSNGRDVVRTDSQGRYRLPVDDDTILFVIKPSGWMTPTDSDNLPRFYYIHRPEGSPSLKYPGIAPTGPLPESIDFPLRPRPEKDRFSVVLFGDPQPRNQQEIDYIAHDVVEELCGVDAAFGLSLGDIMFDNLSLYGSLNKTVACIGLPWYNVLGNHDMNYDSPGDAGSNETFKSVYGPTYYAFDYGPVHFIILDNVVWHGAADGKKGHYTAGLGEKQLEFLKNDLAFVPKDRLVVVSMHIPLRDGETPVADHQALFRLLEDRPHTFSLSAHTHYQEHLFFGKEEGWNGAQPHHHLNHATVCGSWWSGTPDEMGIPHTMMRDGAPNGYSFLHFDRNKYRVEFKAARRPADEQMSIHAPETVAAADTGATDVLVNVYAGSERSRVEMKQGKEERWTVLQKIEAEDPYFAALKAAEQSATPPPGRKLPKIGKSSHLWKGTLPAGLPVGTHLIQVRTTDMFGQTYTDRRVLRVSAEAAEKPT